MSDYNPSSPLKKYVDQKGVAVIWRRIQANFPELEVVTGGAKKIPVSYIPEIPASLLPSYVDDVIEGYKTYSGTEVPDFGSGAYAIGDLVGYNSKVYRFIAAHTAGTAWNASEVEEVPQFPGTGEAGKIYVDLIDGKTYRWSGSRYVVVSETLALGTTSSTAFRGDYGAAAYAHGVTNKGIATSGFNKITTNSEGHVTEVTAVAKSDLTGLGVEDASNKVTSWGANNANATDTNYPSAKLVKDSIDAAATQSVAKMVLSGSNSGTTDADADTANNATYLNIVQNSTEQSSTQVTGAGTVTVSGKDGKLTITGEAHHQAKIVVAGSASATSDAAVDNTGIVRINVVENSTVRSSHKVQGGNKITITSDSNGHITVDHDAQTVTPTTANAKSIANNATSSPDTTGVITGITVDSYGHVTAYTSTPIYVDALSEDDIDAAIAAAEGSGDL